MRLRCLNQKGWIKALKKLKISLKMECKLIKPQKSKILRYLKAFFPFWKKKGVGLYGYFGHGDLGDDASFFVARQLLGKDIFPISKRCNAFVPFNLKALLIGAGAVLKSGYPFIPRRILKEGKRGFPIVLFSAGLGCDYNEEFTSEAKSKIKKLCVICDYITVRDELSRSFLKGLGVDKDIHILPHLELMLKPRQKEPGFKKERFTVGIVLTPHSQFSSEMFQGIVDNFTRFSDYLTAKGYNVVYFPFEKDFSENTKEREILEAIMRKVKDKNRVKLLSGDMEADEALFIMKNYCDFMVCLRLHSAVLAVNAGLPFFCVTYNLMHKGFLEMLEMPELGSSIFDSFSLETLKEKFEYVLKDYEHFKAKLTEKRDFLRGLIKKEISKVRSVIDYKGGR